MTGDRLRVRRRVKVEVAANDHAVFVDWKRLEILSEFAEGPFARQIELDVRNVESRNAHLHALDVGAQRLESTRTRKIANDRHYQVLLFQFLDEAEIVLGAEIVAHLAGEIFGH